MRPKAAGPDAPPFEFQTLSRELAAAHGAALVALGADMEWENWTVANLMMELPEKWRLSTLVMRNGSAVAYAIASRKADSVHLHHLIVGPECRGEGIGAQLISRLSESAHRLGVHRLTLKVHESNGRAMQFYRRLGFTDGPQQANGYIHMVRDNSSPRS